MKNNIVIKIFMILTLFAYAGNCAAAEEKEKLDLTYFEHPTRMWCPESIKPTDPINTHIFFSDHPILLSDKIQIRENGVMWNIPAGYSRPWPRDDEGSAIVGGLHGMVATSTPLRPHGINERDRVGFAFWYPSGRYPELSWQIPWGRVCEHGRPLPKDDEFVVYGEISDAPIRFGPTTPLESWAEYDDKYIKDGSLKYQGTEYGLLKYQSYNDDGTPVQFSKYISKKGQIPQISASCDNPRVSEVNPDCYCNIYYSKEVSFNLHIPNYNFHNWKKIAKMAKDLILPWRENTPHVEGKAK